MTRPSEPSSQPPRHLHELAYLPGTDPARAPLEAELAALSAGDRDQLLEVMRDSDQLYAQLPQIPAPSSLLAKLLSLPDRAAATQPWYRRPLGWQPLAAAAIVLIVLTGYLLIWQTRPPQLGPLNGSLAQTLTSQVIAYQQSPPPLEVAASDATHVQAVLAAHKLSFPVMMLQPRVPLALLGGGTCNLDGAPATFTRWQSPTAHYALYQFDGKPLGIPATFTRTSQTANNQHVIFWPGMGGLCTWALVCDSDTAPDPFSIGYN